ncbi:NUDIX domain-containing protein [Thaumasiovibrio subtropicus]|uniref:NUDIX domain-containing protein n=1 Tax=Thaumasiovibrio subtropicus TaxID=1891207 RepID=UPI000B353F26|nr:NUDIX domain-containing protein [Thaumasiovibrio subtropicus]
MKHRIRAAGILENDGKILLLKVKDHSGEYWIPPGGGLEDEDKCTRDALKREFLEETGLSVTVGAFLFAREFLETHKERYHAEFFYRITDWQGEVSHDNLTGLTDEEFILGADWLSRDDIQKVKVYPEELKHQVWDILRENRYSLHLGSFIEGVD